MIDFFTPGVTGIGYEAERRVAVQAMLTCAAAFIVRERGHAEQAILYPASFFVPFPLPPPRQR